MDSYDKMLAGCHQIYTEYLNYTAVQKPAEALRAEIEQMLLNLETEIHDQSETGANTVLLEKMQQDLLLFREDLAISNS